MGAQGRLSVSDIYALTLPGVRLVTLSACQTALAQRDPGSEVASLADAFEVAGAGSVIATLWSVDDEATHQLMLSLYGQIKQGKSLAQALRKAQLELLSHGRHRAPFFWAAFSLYGDWR
ncbi:CHAT domain-containing protein [bacterium]|nr:CHAT domain-containing protein [bacterium]